MSFDEIYLRYVDSVYSFLKFRLNDDYMVEEVMQETFLAVYRGLERLPTVQSVKAWILAIAHHKLVDYLRRFKPDHVELEPNMYAEEFTTDLTIIEALGQLDHTSAAIVYGLYVEQLTCEEIADILGIPVGTVKSKAYAARGKLRSWLKEVEQ